MFNSSLNKHLSISEHRDILKKRYINKRISTNGLIINENGRYSYIETLTDTSIKGFSINGKDIKNMIKSGFLNYSSGEIIYLKDGFLLNDSTGDTFDFNSSDENLYFDTSILSFNYLNNKTINHFSCLYIRKNETIYKLKRANWNVLFSLNIK